MVDRERLIYLGKMIGVLLLIGVFYLIGVNGWVNNLYDYYAGPVSEWSLMFIDSTKQTFTSIFKSSATLEELNNLKIENANLEAQLIATSTLQTEIDTLTEQLNAKKENQELIEAKILSDGLFDSDDYIIISTGSNDGCEIGQTVVLGGAYVGSISEVYNETSKVQLPNDFQTYLQVRIDHGDKSYNGVAIGTLSGIRVENIVVTAEIENGDAVFITDSKVGDVLVLGKVAEVFGQPNDPSKSAIIDPVINYLDLKYVFVIK